MMFMPGWFLFFQPEEPHVVIQRTACDCSASHPTVSDSEQKLRACLAPSVHSVIGLSSV